MHTEQMAEETASATEEKAAEQKPVAAVEEQDDAVQAVAEEETQNANMAAQVFDDEDIYFDFDSIQLTPQAQEILTKKAKWLRDNPAATVTIEGHCDNRGTNEYNLALGEGRAQSAKTFLMDLGVDVSKLRTISYGEERPLDPQQTESAWAKNRRAHFVIEE